MCKPYNVYGVYVCMCVHVCAGGKHGKQNIFEAKYVIQTKYSKLKKKILSLEPTFHDGKEHPLSKALNL